MKTEDYKIKFFVDPETGRVPVREYLDDIVDKERIKILKYVDFLREHKGILDEPYSKHIRDKIRELRIDFGRNRHRIFYFTFVGKNIILLHAFLKHSDKTPESEITKALNNYHKVLRSPKLYED